MTDTPTPKKKRNPRKSEVPFSFLPKGNIPAVCAYICFLLGLIPGLGVFFGLFAGLIGLLGYFKARKMDPKIGIGHSFVSMVFGPMEFVSHALGLHLLLR